jgi:hypothetical protein
MSDAKEIQSGWTAADLFMKTLIELRNSANQASFLARRFSKHGIYVYFSCLKQLWINIAPFIIPTKTQRVKDKMDIVDKLMSDIISGKKEFSLSEISDFVKKLEELDNEIWSSAIYAGLVVPFTYRTTDEERMRFALGVKK